MAERDVRVANPAACQPTKADMEKDVSIETMPEALAWAVTRGGTDRQENTKPRIR